MRTPAHSNRRIALVNVPYGVVGHSMRPIGLSCIIAHLRSAGIDSVGFDFSDSMSSGAKLVEEFRLADFEIVGLSFYNINALIAYEMAATIKAIDPKILIVAGGPHASAADAKMLEMHGAIDVVVRNEGELSFTELVNARFGGHDLTQIPGITHRATDGTIVRERDRERIKNLDALPAPWADFISDHSASEVMFSEEINPLLRNGRNRQALPMVTSRSCPYGCNFCAITLIGREWRAASPDKVVSDFCELDRRADGAYSHIYFLDANFMVDAKRALAIAKQLQAAKPGITFSFATRVNQIIKCKTLLAEMVENGLRSIELGIESGSAEALTRFAKDVTVEQNDEALRLLRQYGIRLGLDFIMFDAEMNLSDLRANLDFFERNDLDSHVPWESYFTHMTPYLGTAIRTRYESLLGQNFEIDILPRPSSLILDKQVRHIFDQFHLLCDTVGEMQRAVMALDSRLAVNRYSEREAARDALNAASLRRFYFNVLDALVEAGERGVYMRLDDAIPQFETDDGSPATLEEVLAYVVHGHKALRNRPGSGLGRHEAALA